MIRDRSFRSAVLALAVPTALQSMLQSSFSIVDQIMIGQLGEISIAGVGFAGKFSSIFSVVASAVGAVAGIMLAQYLGQKNEREVRRSFFVNLALALSIALLFTVLCLAFPAQIMRLYIDDAPTVRAAAEYLSLIAFTFVPLAGATLLATLYRCMDRARLPLYASIASALLNTSVNYILIFGKLGVSPMGARGAAIATVLSQWANLGIMLALLPRGLLGKRSTFARVPFAWGQYLAMLLPILVCEVVWSLGENVYAMIYGHLGTAASAAMTLTSPVQGLVIGALCGLSQAASVIVGKRLGSADYDGAYAAGKTLLVYGLLGAAALSLVVLAISPFYVRIYRVDDAVRLLTRQILFAYALVAPLKVLNMILGGGILRSGGQTKYVMVIDALGTWGFGVPMGLLAAFVWEFSIPYVYFLLSLEEGVRLAISLVVFRRKKWMKSLTAAQ